MTRLRAFFDRFPDTEGEQATIRAVFCPIVAAAYMYSLPENDGTWPIDHRLLYLMVSLYALAAGLILVSLVTHPRPSFPRRVVALVVDASTVTATMLATYEYGIAFFGFFMWICLGYGLRYGARFLRLAQGVTVAGFLIVLTLSPYWQGHLQIGLGLLVTMFYLPPLASLVLERARKARSEAVEANQAKSRFVANISHEIRTPLNAIIGFTDMLSSSRLSSDQEQWMKGISSSAALLLSLVNNVLDLARIEAGKVTIVSRQFSVRELVDGVVSVLRPQAEAKGLYVRVDQLPEDALLLGDPDHVTQALVNLVANAIKFTERGGVTLRITSVSKAPDRLVVTWHVIDTGVGMTPEAASRIFESFAQADEQTRRRYGGTGLGTTIAKELIERMGGRIGVESELQKGSHFWFSLPFVRAAGIPEGAATGLATASDSPAPQTMERPAHAGPASLAEARPRILVVEDNAANRKVVEKILQRGGYEVHVADCGLSALVNLACERYDLLLLDMELPGLNGLELLRRLRARYGSQLKVVMLTANATPEAKSECLSAGADGFLTKPISPKTFLASLGSMLSSAAPRPWSGAGMVSTDRLKEQLALGQNLDFVLELIDLWRDDADQAIAALQRAVRQNDPAEVRRYLHLLEGGAIEVGAAGFIESCRHLRKLVHDEERRTWNEAMEHLSGAYRSTCLVFDSLSSMAERQPQAAS